MVHYVFQVVSFVFLVDLLFPGTKNRRIRFEFGLYFMTVSRHLPSGVASHPEVLRKEDFEHGESQGSKCCRWLFFWATLSWRACVVVCWLGIVG